MLYEAAEFTVIIIFNKNTFHITCRHAIYWQYKTTLKNPETDNKPWSISDVHMPGTHAPSSGSNVELQHHCNAACHYIYKSIVLLMNDAQ